MQKQKGFIQILAVALVILAAAAVGLYYYVGFNPKTSTMTNDSLAPEYQESYQEAAQGVAPVSNTSELDKVSAELDAADTTQIDTDLKMLSSDASAF